MTSQQSQNTLAGPALLLVGLLIIWFTGSFFYDLIVGIILAVIGFLLTYHSYGRRIIDWYRGISI